MKGYWLGPYRAIILPCLFPFVGGEIGDRTLGVGRAGSPSSFCNTFIYLVFGLSVCCFVFHRGAREGEGDKLGRGHTQIQDKALT